ncbi:hypothetical protein M1L60_07100 [Actinoplanes sp. TRM 88003]|uniref:Uncharacterized protein n=1 Tax=Paractinoplanes aksuensis TaxID=2939490 RepID=A0ABT1DHR2_9ACTN|nr:hypothetical protein [Actinoplanes aksuensis]MCO8270362.1 hypothetical protein [Actinoplanes aksuensis]
MTLALGSAVALFLYPHTLTGVLAARNRGVLRRNLAVLPMYTLTLGVLMPVGFAALYSGTKPRGGDTGAARPRLPRRPGRHAGARLRRRRGRPDRTPDDRDHRRRAGTGRRPSSSFLPLGHRASVPRR